MPNAAPWDNFAVCLYTFVAIYCAHSGYARSDPEAAKVESFAFHNHYTWRTRKKLKKVAKDDPVKSEPVTRKKPFIFFLHKKMVNGRARFVNKVDKNFGEFIKLFSKNNKEFTQLLMDHGKGDDTVEYLAAFELGLCRYSDDIFALGTHPLRNREYWSKVSLWRKREAYIALARHVLKRDPNYNQWDCFRFRDYQDRQSLSRTFMKRHLPLSDGRDEVHFQGKLTFDWDKHAYSPVKRKGSGVVKKEVKKTKPSSQTTTCA